MIHGVERIEPNWGYQDFWALKQSIFFAVLDGLAARRDRGDLWIADHIGAHQYETERATAKVEVLHRDAAEIRMRLTCEADPRLYDAPLTLVTRLPDGWSACALAQPGSNTVLNAVGGRVAYDIVPDGAVFALRRR